MRSGMAIDMGWWADEHSCRCVRLSWAADLGFLYLYHAVTNEAELLAVIPEEGRVKELFGNWIDHPAAGGVGWARELAAVA